MSDYTVIIEAPDTEATGAQSAACLDVAAYLDGELDAAGGTRFEQHTKTCAPCATALREQRRLLCVLDAARPFAAMGSKVTWPIANGHVVRPRGFGASPG